MVKHTKRLFVFLILTFILALLLFPMRSGVEDYIEVDTTSIMLSAGTSQKIEYALRSEFEQSIVFSSGNNSIAIVDQQGVVTAISPGTTDIWLKAQYGATAKVSATVEGTPILAFELREHELQLNKGDVSGLSYSVNSGASINNIVWSSDAPEIASVDSMGRVHAVSGGETVIHATVPGGLSDSVIVYVHVTTDAVSISPSEIRVAAGTAYPLTMHFLPVDSTDEPSRWRSSDPSIVAIDDTGLMKAIKPGSVTITATSEQGISGSTMITVEAPVQGLFINPNSIVLERGEETVLEAWYVGENALPVSGIDHYIEWQSSSEDCVRVENGKIIALQSGSAIITALSDGYEARCAVQVVTTVREVELAVAEVYMLREQTGAPYQIRADVTPEDADDTTLTYSSNNTLVANVDANGLVTMTGGYGTAIITVESASGIKVDFAVHVVTQLPNY